jgi:hypothetical protein
VGGLAKVIGWVGRCLVCGLGRVILAACGPVYCWCVVCGASRHVARFCCGDAAVPIATTFIPMLAGVLGGAPPLHLAESPSAVNRRRKEDQIAFDNLAIYKRLQVGCDPVTGPRPPTCVWCAITQVVMKVGPAP